jgi:hypothetical protein
LLLLPLRCTIKNEDGTADREDDDDFISTVGLLLLLFAEACDMKE